MTLFNPHNNPEKTAAISISILDMKKLKDMDTTWIVHCYFNNQNAG